MSKMKKVLLMCTAYVLVAALAIGGTIAYLQDDDSDVNVMTLGNVSIAQHEYERVVDENGEYKIITVTKADGSTQESYELQEFTQAKPLYPAVGDPNGGYTATYVRFEQLDDPSKVQGGQQMHTIKNAQDKLVLVENTGKTAAFVRTLIAFEAGSYNYDEWKDVIVKINGNDGEPWKYTDIQTPISIDGNNYIVVEAVYTGYSYGNMRHNGGILPAGEWTYNNLAGVYMAPTATNEDVEALDGNKNGTYDILVLSQAVQVAGFSDAQTALDTAFGKTSEKAAEWFGGVISVSGASDFDFESAPADALKVEGNDKAAVIAAINSAEPGDTVVLTQDTAIAGYAATEKLVIEKDITLDLNGYTLTTECGWGGIDLKGGASIVNGTINHTGNTAAIKAFNVGKIENVVINVTETEGKTKGGIVVQNSGGSYVGSIKNVVINGATNGIETYNCGGLGYDVIGSMENVTINAIDTGMLLSAPIGEVTNCTISGEKIGVNAFIKGAYNVSANFVNCKISGANADIYAHDEVGKTNPGSMNVTYEAAMALNLNVIQEFEAEIADRVFVGIK